VIIALLLIITILIFRDYNTAFKRIVKHCLYKSIKVVIKSLAFNNYNILIFNVYKLKENSILLISYILNLFLVF
jgi:hypothetical protein